MKVFRRFKKAPTYVIKNAPILSYLRANVTSSWWFNTFDTSKKNPELKGKHGLFSTFTVA